MTERDRATLRRWVATGLAVVFGFLVWFALGCMVAHTAHAQANEPVDPGGGGGTTFDIGNLGGLGETIQHAVEEAGSRALTNWFQGPGQESILRLLGFLVGMLVRAVWTLADGAAGLRGEQNQSIIVAIPDAFTFGNPWVQQAHGVFQGAVNIGLFGAMALALVVMATGSLFGFVRDEAQGVLPWVFLLAVLNNTSWQMGRQLAVWFNGLAATFANPLAMFPGWDSLNGVEQASGLGFASLAYVLLGLLLLLSRWGVVITVAILSATAPVFLLCGLIPGMSILFQWWVRRLLLLLFQQVPQAMALGFGASLLAAFGAGANGMTLILGIAALVAAWRLPHWLPLNVEHGPSLYKSARQTSSLVWKAYMAREVSVVSGAAGVAGKAAQGAADDVLDAEWRPVTPASGGPVWEAPGLPAPSNRLPGE